MGVDSCMVIGTFGSVLNCENPSDSFIETFLTQNQRETFCNFEPHHVVFIRTLMSGLTGRVILFKKKKN